MPMIRSRPTLLIKRRATFRVQVNWHTTNATYTHHSIAFCLATAVMLQTCSPSIPCSHAKMVLWVTRRLVCTIHKCYICYPLQTYRPTHCKKQVAFCFNNILSLKLSINYSSDQRINVIAMYYCKWHDCSLYIKFQVSQKGIFRKSHV